MGGWNQIKDLLVGENLRPSLMGSKVPQADAELGLLGAGLRAFQTA
jgi:hypothetical protein